MPFKNKEDKNAYQRQYWINNPDKYKEHKKQCCENMRRIRKKEKIISDGIHTQSVLNGVIPL